MDPFDNVSYFGNFGYPQKHNISTLHEHMHIAYEQVNGLYTNIEPGYQVLETTLMNLLYRVSIQLKSHTTFHFE